MHCDDSLITFFSKFHVMLSNGIPLIRSLKILSKETVDASFSQAIDNIAANVSAGTVLSNAMADYPEYFDETLLDILATGEKHGILDTMTGVIPQIILFRRLEEWKN